MDRELLRAACCCALFACTGAAQGLVVPAAKATSNGDTTSGAPFGYTNYVRYQQAIGPTHFPGAVVIYGMSFRSQTTWPNTPDIQVQGLQVQLADSLKAATTLDATFANNIGPNVTTVFNSTVSVLRLNTADPLEFNVLVPFPKPYLHTNSAPLLIDLVPTSLGTLPCGKGGNGTACDFVSTDADMGWLYGQGTCAAPPLAMLRRGPGGFVVKLWTASALLPFSRACAGTSVPQISSTGLPTPGNAQFAIGLAQAPLGTPALAALLLGASAVTWGGGSLPFELTPLGMPTCYLSVSPDLTVSSAVTGGAASVGLPIPNDVGLLGLALFAQWLSVADGANALGAVLTQGGRVTIR